MANISDLLNKIKSARYGRDVRSAIYDSIDAMNTESANAYDAAITAQNSAQASAKAASGSVTSATEAATNAKKYSDSAKQYAESASVAIQAAYDTKTTTDKHITNAVDAPMMVTKFTKNLLNPALETTTSNGVTCTKNNDGTYTLNGTATSFTYFYLVTAIENNFSGLKYIGAPEGSNWNTYFLWGMYRDKNKAETANLTSYNSGTIIESKEKYPYLDFRIAIRQGQTFNNLTFKPMLTTDIEATYDDFVPYSGYDIKTCGKNIAGNPSNLNSPTVKDGVVTFPAKSAATNDAYLRLYTDVDLSAFDTFRVVVESINCTINDGNKSYVLIKTAGKKEFSTLSATSFESSANKYVSNVFNCSDFGNKIAEITVIVKKGYAYPGGSYKISVFNGEVKEFSSWVKYVESSVHIDSSTEFPLLGLKSFNGETNIISPGNVEVSHALTDTGKYVMQNMKDISDIKAAIVASGSTTE